MSDYNKDKEKDPVRRIIERMGEVIEKSEGLEVSKAISSMCHASEVDNKKGYFVTLDKRLKPYDYHVDYLRKMAKLRYNYGEEDARFRNIVADILETCEVVELDASLIPIVESTKNEIFYRKLFFERVLINTDLRVGEFILKGIMIIDRMAQKEKIEDWILMTSALHKDTGCGVLVVTALIENVTSNYGDELINSTVEQIHECLRTMACNVVDMVENNDADIDITKIVPTVKQQAKRDKLSKLHLPTRIYIRPRAHFRIVLDEFNKTENEEQEHRKMTHRFKVMGYWRHFRNERYSKEVRQKPRWVKPHWRGEGIVVRKVRKVMP